MQPFVSGGFEYGSGLLNREPAVTFYLGVVTLTSLATLRGTISSRTTIYAAKTAGILSIGYANKPAKAQGLSMAGADDVITDLAELGRVVSTL